MVVFFFFLAQEILNSFYGAIRIYCFNRAECSLEQAKMRKRKKGGKEAEVAEGMEMEKREKKMGDCPHSSGSRCTKGKPKIPRQDGTGVTSQLKGRHCSCRVQ